MSTKEKQKKQIKDLHNKYYKGKTKPAGGKAGKKHPKKSLPLIEVPAQVVAETERFRKEVVLGNTGRRAGSRADLMDQARLKGIKNFRVLNKAELEEVILETTTADRKKEIVAGAVTRWKAGWGKKKVQNESQS